MLGITSFSEIDPRSWSEKIIQLKAEPTLLEQSSKELRQLRDRLRDLESSIESGEQELTRLDAISDFCEIDSKNVCRGPRREQQLDRFPQYDHAATENAFADIVFGQLYEAMRGLREASTPALAGRKL